MVKSIVTVTQISRCSKMKFNYSEKGKKFWIEKNYTLSKFKTQMAKRNNYLWHLSQKKD